MDKYQIRGDEVRRGGLMYLDALSQTCIDSLATTALPEQMLRSLSDDSHPLRPQSAQQVAQAYKAAGDLAFALRLLDTDRCIAVSRLGDIAWSARHARLHVALVDEACFNLETLRDAIQTMLQFAYWEANLNRIAVHCLEDNDLWREALADIGFAEEGQLRQAVYRGGRYLNRVIYAILRRDWAVK